MDTNLKIKEDGSFPDDVAPQSETEFFPKVVSMQRYSDAVLADYCCDVPINTEIKSEAPFTKHLVQQIKSEAVTCSSSWEIHGKAVFDETLSSDFGSQRKGELLSEGPVTKLGKFNSDHEMGNKIEIKEEPLRPETETSDMCDDIKGEEFPPVNSSRLCTQELSGVVTEQSPLIADEVSGRDISFCPGKDNPEYAHQKSNVTGVQSAEEVLSEETAKCSEREEMYLKPSQLKQKTLIHNSKKPHKCETCDMSFTQFSHLKRHYLIHEGKKPHKCKACDKGFTQLSDLKRHYLIHEGKRPHQCKTCDKSFTQLGGLKIHSFIHESKKPHQCKTCDKRFTQLVHLKTHNFMHDGTKPYKCETCSKRFINLSNLKRHYLAHESKK